MVSAIQVEYWLEFYANGRWRPSQAGMQSSLDVALATLKRFGDEQYRVRVHITIELSGVSSAQNTTASNAVG